MMLIYQVRLRFEKTKNLKMRRHKINIESNETYLIVKLFGINT